MSRTKPLSEAMPPFVLGTGTFNTQFHPDPANMPYTDIVRSALAHGVTAFDTSPFYGPSEILLGQALGQLTPPPPREEYFLITKAGRIGSKEFDYTPSWVRYSVCRSLERLGTTYIDLVYMHDVEFVSPAEVLGAIKELRRMRDEGLIRYIGISGYPLETLASLAEMVLAETGEPLNAIMSYAHFSVQNSLLGDDAVLERFKAAGVQCVPNASPLGMALLTTKGVDNQLVGEWHPAPPELRAACKKLPSIAQTEGLRIEEVAFKWSLKKWADVGGPLGTSHLPRGLSTASASGVQQLPSKTGIIVTGVLSTTELEENVALWRSVVGKEGAAASNAALETERVQRLVEEQMWPSLGQWKDFAWGSGGKGFENERKDFGVIPDDDIAKRWGLKPEMNGSA